MKKIMIYKNLWALAFAVCFSGIVLKMEVKFVSEYLFKEWGVGETTIGGVNTVALIELVASVEVLCGAVLLFWLTHKIRGEQGQKNII